MSRKEALQKEQNGEGKQQSRRAGGEGHTTAAQQLQCLSQGQEQWSEPPLVPLQLQSHLPLPWGTEEATCAPAVPLVFPCRNHLSQIPISAQGLPSQTKKLSL